VQVLGLGDVGESPTMPAAIDAAAWACHSFECHRYSTFLGSGMAFDFDVAKLPELSLRAASRRLIPSTSRPGRGCHHLLVCTSCKSSGGRL